MMMYGRGSIRACWSGGVALLPDEGEDAGKVQSVGARYTHGEITMEQAQEATCRACASPGGGCQFLGTAATSQVVAEALGMSLTHAALAPSGHPIWLDAATRSAKAVLHLIARGIAMRDILNEAAFRNALIVHAAFGGSTNLVIHVPAVAYHAGVRRPTVEDWSAINRKVPRRVDALPNGPMFHPTARVFQAGGVPEVMLHLKRAGLLELDVMTVSGLTLGAALDWWEGSERRRVLRERRRLARVHPSDVIMSPSAPPKGLRRLFPVGNLAPAAASSSPRHCVVDADGVYRKRGPAKVFTTERSHPGRQGRGEKRLLPGDILVLCAVARWAAAWRRYIRSLRRSGISPSGSRSRFSPMPAWRCSTGAALAHNPGSAGGPLGKVRDGDIIEIAWTASPGGKREPDRGTAMPWALRRGTACLRRAARIRR